MSERQLAVERLVGVIQQFEYDEFGHAVRDSLLLRSVWDFVAVLDALDAQERSAALERVREER